MVKPTLFGGIGGKLREKMSNGYRNCNYHLFSFYFVKYLLNMVLCQDLVQVKMSFSHSNLPAIPKLPVDTILQNHRVTYNRNDYEFVWYYKTFPSIQIPGGMHVCNC